MFWQHRCQMNKYVTLCIILPVTQASDPPGCAEASDSSENGMCAQQGGQRAKLSRDLVALWADDYAPAMNLLRRVFPPGLLRYLSTPRAATSSSASDGIGAGQAGCSACISDIPTALS